MFSLDLWRRAGGGGGGGGFAAGPGFKPELCEASKLHSLIPVVD